MSRLDSLRARLHRRKAHRERKRRLKQGHKAKREARAVRRLRRALRWLSAPRTMYDAVTVTNIPPRARAVAGYVNGDYRTYTALVSGWPRARKVSIAVSSDVNADFLDVEAGDATNADAVAWFRQHKRNRGFYTSASNADALVATLQAAGIHRDEYTLWTAHYAGKHICGPHTCGEVRSTEADGTQFTTHEETLDESVLKPSFWERR